MDTILAFIAWLIEKVAMSELASFLGDLAISQKCQKSC